MVIAGTRRKGWAAGGVGGGRMARLERVGFEKGRKGQREEKRGEERSEKGAC